MDINLSSKIKNIAEKDNSLRSKYASRGENKDELKGLIRQLDIDNTATLKKAVSLHGWRNVIISGGDDCWYLVQHADLDVRFQSRAYKAMIRYGDGHIDRSKIAMLYDRIKMNKGLPQKYGTQLRKDKNKGRWLPWLIKDEDKIDEYRSSVGLRSIDEYIHDFNSQF